MRMDQSPAYIINLPTFSGTCVKARGISFHELHDDVLVAEPTCLTRGVASWTPPAPECIAGPIYRISPAWLSPLGQPRRPGWAKQALEKARPISPNSPE